MGARRRRGADRSSLIAALLAIALPAAADNTEIAIQQGVTSITPEEAKIQADPAAGIQHGVILLEETSRDETKGTGYLLSYHLRAKILSPEGRSLADVEIPVERSANELKAWWGRTILPSGEVRELHQRELKLQEVASTSTIRTVTLKGALPAVVPGSVIDYGYVVRGEGYFPFTTVELEREWPVQALRYRWVPSPHLPAAFTSTRTNDRNVKVVHDSRSLLVTASSLSPVKEEPYMPPEGEVRASITLYYGSGEQIDEFWELEARRAETRTKSFSSGGAMKEAIAAMAIPPDAPLATRLQIAYDWVGANVKNSWQKTAEEQEADSEEDSAHNAKTVLRAREGTGRQIDYLYAGLARALGADAVLVYAVDRTDRYWNRGLKSLGQFDYSFVGVREPGAGDGAWTVVDPGSGLPYGELPWNATGSTAFVCTPKGKDAFVIPPSAGTKNRSDTRVTIGFTEDAESYTAKWSRIGLGASGMGYRRWLRDLDPSERKEQLDRLCGGVGSGEVIAAELPGLDDPSAPYQIACDITAGETNLTEDVHLYQTSVLGAWWPVTPELPAATRVHPVVFDYPKLDIVSIDLVAPAGFAPKEPPAPIKVESPYGRYQLVATKTDKGYHVDRAFALVPLYVKPPDYAELKSFLDRVHAGDRTSLAFERTQESP